MSSDLKCVYSQNNCSFLSSSILLSKFLPVKCRSKHTWICCQFTAELTTVRITRGVSISRMTLSFLRADCLVDISSVPKRICRQKSETPGQWRMNHSSAWWMVLSCKVGQDWPWRTPAISSGRPKWCFKLNSDVNAWSAEVSSVVVVADGKNKAFIGQIGGQKNVSCPGRSKSERKKCFLHCVSCFLQTLSGWSYSRVDYHCS